MGASTIYGIHVGDEETSASQLERRFGDLQGSRKVEVINAGVPGWVSSETLRSLTGRVLRLHPDIILVADGRNEIFPQLFNNYRDDYKHYRRNYDSRDSNYQYKNLFRVSYLLMVLITRGPGHLGFSNRDENPSYAVIDYANAPTDDDILRNSAQPARLNAFRRNLEQIIQLCRENNVKPVLSTIPFIKESYVSNNIQADAQTLPVIAKQAETNNDLIRTIAGELNVPLVDPALSLSREDLLVDDCHFNKQGEKAYADLMFKAMAPFAAEKN
jgi:lysophospholipase L1-like esterase